MMPIRIGILNLMHDKVATQQRFERLLKQAGQPVSVTFFYPVSHYADRPVPELVAKISLPLDLKQATAMDGFIITGAPVENLAYDEVEYIDEVRNLIDALNQAHVVQLYVCWGAMVAANYLYGVGKHRLAKKYFGVFENQVVAPDPLLTNLPRIFLAPHARYAELNEEQIGANLTVTARSKEGYLTSARGSEGQSFLFAHLEYGQNALLEEYQREIAAHPERHYQRPSHYFQEEVAMKDRRFGWQKTQAQYFDNWVRLVAAERSIKVCKIG